MMSLATFLLSFAGYVALALSMPKHHRDLFGEPPRQSRGLALRITGWGLLAVSLTPAIASQGVSVGIVLWCGVATVAALLVAMLLTYRDLWWRL